jgi:hypothetical protein
MRWKLRLASLAMEKLVSHSAWITVPSPGAGTSTGTVQFVDTTFNKILAAAELRGSRDSERADHGERRTVQHGDR